MKIGVRRLPRLRDPRRRFRNRLLVGMVGVALLPLVAFAVLAVFELDTVAKSTANATETAILQRQESQQQSGVDARALALDTRLSAIDSQLTLVAQTLTKQLAATPATTPLPKGLTNAGDVSYVDAGGVNSNTLVLGTDAAAQPDGRFAAATSSTAVLSDVQTTLKNDSVAAVWFANQTTGALRAFPAFPVSGALSGQRYDVTHPSLRNGLDVFATSEGGVATIAPNAWIAPGEPGRDASGPFWTDPYELLENGEQGVTVWFSLLDNQTVVGFDLSEQAVATLISAALGAPAADTSSLIVSASGKLVFGTAQAFTDFPNSTVGSPLTAPGQTTLTGALHHMESTGALPAAPVAATLSKSSDDVFVAPVYSAHWIVASPVAINALEPNLNSLTLGITDGIHRLFPVTVLPVLVLLVVLAFIATTLLSRRMYLPVQALTDHAVLEERTRLAREIHDTLAQQLTGIVLELEAADTLLNRGSEGRARSSVEKARELARGALQEARRSVWNLRPAPLSATGLVAAIGHEVEAWEERTGIPARFKARAVPQHPSLSPTAEVALLRIGQEALSNAARHGHPEHVDVELRAHRQELVLSVSDDGVGFDPAASAPREDCFGLDGMAERARNAGGTLTVVSSPGRGTTITTRLPLSEPVAIAETG
ncbi:MAG TPA: sensor histidine kinase [Candidatus Dormibacteraeota bacterium]